MQDADKFGESFQERRGCLRRQQSSMDATPRLLDRSKDNGDEVMPSKEARRVAKLDTAGIDHFRSPAAGPATPACAEFKEAVDVAVILMGREVTLYRPLARRVRSKALTLRMPNAQQPIPL